eukprot:1143743-Pelagomonas_calceolata.AAC.1
MMSHIRLSAEKIVLHPWNSLAFYAFLFTTSASCAEGFDTGSEPAKRREHDAVAKISSLKWATVKDKGDGRWDCHGMMEDGTAIQTLFAKRLSCSITGVNINCPHDSTKLQHTLGTADSLRQIVMTAPV